MSTPSTKNELPSSSLTMKTAVGGRAYRRFSDDELNWVRENYVGLQVREAGELLCGTLNFWGKYADSNQKQLELNDEYQVRIRIDTDNIPYVWETASRLKSLASKLGKKNLEDIHVYPQDEEICMGTIPTMRKIYSEDPTMEGLFRNIIIRSFYYYAYLEKMGEEPWTGLPHGFLGVLKEYASNPGDPLSYAPYLKGDALRLLSDKKQLGRNQKCLCQRGKVKHCNCGAIDEYNVFRKDYRRAARV